MDRLTSSGPGAHSASPRRGASLVGRHRRRRRHRPIGLERLEGRTLLATQDLGPLRFSADAFTTDGGMVSADGMIEVGLTPTGTEAFTPLISVDGAFSFTRTMTDQRFSIREATLSSIVSGAPIALLPSTTRDFAVADLVGNGSSLTDGMAVPVAGVGFTPATIKLDNPGGPSTVDARVALQGAIAIPQLEGLSLPVGGMDFVIITGAGVSLTGVAVAGQQFDAFGLTVKTSDLKVAFSGANGAETFSFTGSVTVADDDISFTGSLGNATTPGLVVTDGVVTQLDIGISASIQVASLAINVDGLNFSYNSTSQLYEVSGAASLSVSGTTIAAQLGTMDSPGLKFQGGVIDTVNVALSGTFELFDLGIQISRSNPLRLQFQRGMGTTPDRYVITGAITVPELFNASVALGGTGADGKPQPGIVIVGNSFMVDGFALSLSDVPLGAFTVQTLAVSYREVNSEVDFDATLEILFPQGWAVGGVVKFVDGELDEVGLSLMLGDTPIPIGDTGLFLAGMSADVKNLDQPENLVVSGSLTVDLGDQVEIFGETVTLARAVGSFTVDKDELILDAQVFMAAVADMSGNTTGLLGEGDGRLSLDWGAQVYRLDVSASLYDGVFTFDAGFAFDGRGDVTINAKAAVNFPRGLPLIGGLEIGELDFLFEYRPPETPGGQAIGFVAAWIELDLFFKFDIGVEFNFEDKDTFSIIGTSQVDALKQGATNPAPRVYTYFSSFTVPAGATSGTLAVDWPTAGGVQTIAIKPANGAAIDQAQFSAANGLALVPQLNTSRTTRKVNVVGSSTDEDAPLPAGEYQLILTSTEQYEAMPTFTGTFSYPDPTVAVGAVPANPGSLTVPVPVAGTADGAFTDQTRIALYLDTDDSGFDETLIADDVAFSPDGNTINFDLAGLLPVPYYVYAIINDGTNTPVTSAYSAAITPTPSLSGTVTNPMNGDEALPGFTVFLDKDGNGRFDPATDPFTTTGATGFYAFYVPTLPVGTPIGVGVVVPNGFQFDPNSPAPNPKVITYDGTNPVAVSFEVDEFAAIRGTVFNDLAAGRVALPAMTVFLDANGNGLLDAGERSTQTGSDGRYTFHGPTPNSTQTVRVQVPQGFFQTVPAAPGTDTVQVTAEPFRIYDGNDFGLLPFSTISGTVTGHVATGGVLNPATQPLQGWTVNLLRDGVQVATTTSAADGSYSFGGLMPGTYTVVEVVRPGFREISPSSGRLQLQKPGGADTGGIDTSGVPGPVVMADFDGDGRPDLAVLDSNALNDSGFPVYIFNHGDFPGFTYALLGSVSDIPQSMVAFSTGSGLPGLAVLYFETGQVDLFANVGGILQQGAPLAQFPIDPSDDADYFQIEAGQFVRGVPGEQVAVLYGDGEGQTSVAIAGPGVAATVAFTITSNPSGIMAVADINGDGVDDIFITSPGQASPIVYYGDGTGRFSPVTIGVLPSSSFTPVLGDIDGDGRLDLGVLDTSGGFHYAIQNAAGSFPQAISPGVTVGSDAFDSATLQDVNGDFRPDLVTAAITGDPLGLYVALNTGAPGSWFTPDQLTRWPLSAPLQNVGGNLPFLATGDWDGDGLADVVVTDPGNGLVELVLNGTTFQATAITVPVLGGQDPTGVDFVNAQLGQVNGRVFEDLNRDGIALPTEPGRAGVTVYVDLNRDGRLDPGEPRALTGADGAYAFDGLPAGTYQVRVLGEAGRRLTTPGGNLFEFNVSDGQPSLAGLDFGSVLHLVEPIADLSIAESETLSFVVNLTAAAAEQGSNFRFRLGPGAPDGARIDPATGEFTWTPTEAQGPGVFSITVFAFDALDPAFTEAVTFTVTVVELSDSLQYVTALYRSVLGREPDPPGLAYWVGLLDAGATRSQVATGFWGSPEHLGIQVDRLYATYLGRPADPAGRASWVNALMAGLAETTAARLFLSSPEYRSTHRDAIAYIGGLYRDVLGREPDPIGLAFWTRAARLGVGRAAIAHRFLTSPESFGRRVDIAYREALGRDADPDGRVSWIRQLANRRLNPSRVAVAFLASPEFFDRALEGLPRPRLLVHRSR